jgi:hypothetical protein
MSAQNLQNYQVNPSLIGEIQFYFGAKSFLGLNADLGNRKPFRNCLSYIWVFSAHWVVLFNGPYRSYLCGAPTQCAPKKSNCVSVTSFLWKIWWVSHTPVAIVTVGLGLCVITTNECHALCYYNASFLRDVSNCSVWFLLLSVIVG